MDVLVRGCLGKSPSKLGRAEATNFHTGSNPLYPRSPEELVSVGCRKENFSATISKILTGTGTNPNQGLMSVGMPAVIVSVKFGPETNTRSLLTPQTSTGRPGAAMM